MKPKPIIRYWHPRKGGWYHATIVKQGRKWAIVETLQQHNGIVVATRRHRVAIADVREAVL